MLSSNLIYSFSGFIATDFSSFYIDGYGTYPNSLIPTNDTISIFNGNYTQIIPYLNNGFYVNTEYNGETLVPYINFTIQNPTNYFNKEGILKYMNYQQWVFSNFFITIGSDVVEFTNATFNPIFITDNKKQFDLINDFKGLTFPKSPAIWYSSQEVNQVNYSLQLIWGQGDIPEDYYTICGFTGINNIKAQNSFTNTNGFYYYTYILPNNNYSSNSGWIIVLGGIYDSTLVNPPYIEDI